MASAPVGGVDGEVLGRLQADAVAVLAGCERAECPDDTVVFDGDQDRAVVAARVQALAQEPESVLPGLLGEGGEGGGVRAGRMYTSKSTHACPHAVT